MRQILLQNATAILLQNASGFLLQNATVLLQNATVITKYDIYYKLRQYTVVFSDISMTKFEKDAILTPRKPKLYRFVDNIFTRCKTNVPEKLLEFLNNYHPNIKLTCEISPEKSLDNSSCSVTIKVHQKATKPTGNWSSSIPKRF